MIITDAIDNLIKGARGRAVQNLNLMFGLEETTGLLRACKFSEPILSKGVIQGVLHGRIST